jgi:hypothetical protein
MKHADLISRSKERSRKMSSRRLLQQAFGLTLGVLLLTGCGLSHPGPGIDEPIVVENISVQDMFGTTATGDLEMQILEAYTEESLESGDSGPTYPDDPSDIFLTLMLDLEGPSNSVDWVALNATLICDSEAHQAERSGLRVGEDGLLEGWLVIYAVPGDTDFRGCTVQLPDGRGIELASFFE